MSIGFYGPGIVCFPCPDGATCAGRNTSPIPNPGYWESDLNPDVFVPCIPPEACQGGVDNLCALGYIGERCGQCDIPHFFRLGTIAIVSSFLQTINLIFLFKHVPRDHQEF